MNCYKILNKLKRMKTVLSYFLFLTFILTKETFLTDHILPVYGNASLGYYYVTVFVGTPPQQQSVIIDTGSGQLAMPCNQCKSCSTKHINPPFDLTQSRTSKFVTCQSKDPFCINKCRGQSMTQPCKFSIFYAEGSSLQGVIIKDFIQFQKDSDGEGIETNFGCTTKQTNLFLKQQANGIFGLAPQRTSTLLQDLYKKHNPYSGQKLQFSLCLTGNGGVMNLGSINQSIHSSSQSVKTTYMPHHNLYSLNGIGDIKIGDQFLHTKGQTFGMYGLFIDSGSTFTYFPRNQFISFKKQLSRKCDLQKQICQHAQGEQTLCFHLKTSQSIQIITDRVFPQLQIQIQNKIVFWKASKYFLIRDINNRQICLGVDSLDRFLLGANWMVDRDIVFNLQEKTVQIFLESMCLPKTSQTRMMNQYTQTVQGHQPLNYGSGFNSNTKQIVVIFVGIIFIVFGLFGLILMVLVNRKNRAIIRAVQQVETQQFLE